MQPRSWKDRKESVTDTETNKTHKRGIYVFGLKLSQGNFLLIIEMLLYSGQYGNMLRYSKSRRCVAGSSPSRPLRSPRREKTSQRRSFEERRQLSSHLSSSVPVNSLLSCTPPSIISTVCLSYTSVSLLSCCHAGVCWVFLFFFSLQLSCFMSRRLRLCLVLLSNFPAEVDLLMVVGRGLSSGEWLVLSSCLLIVLVLSVYPLKSLWIGSGVGLISLAEINKVS